MRLAGLGLLALLLAGLLILLAQTGAFDTSWNRLTGDDHVRIPDYEKAISTISDIEGKDVFAAPVDTGSPPILSGIPSFANLTFHLPVDSRVTGGTLKLTYASQVAEGVEGALRVMVNGVKRGDLLLLDGTRKERVDIELTRTELLSGTVNVGLSLQGRGQIDECSLDDSIPAVVAIEPESGLRLQLDAPVASIADRLALWGERVPIGWPASQELPAVIAAARMFQKGYTPVFAAQGLWNDDLTRLALEAKNLNAADTPPDYPIPLVTQGSNGGARSFDRSTTWRYHYRVADLPDQLLPAALELRLVLGPVSKDRVQDIAVTLNGHYVYSQRIRISSDQLNRAIALPASLQLPRNTIEISLGSVDPGENRCGASNNALAELLPETVLRGGSQTASDPLSTLRTMLHEAGEVRLTGDHLAAADAQLAAMVLGRLDPSNLNFGGDRRAPEIAIVTGDLQAIGTGRRARPGDWVVYPANEGALGVIAIPANEINVIEWPALALVVTFPEDRADERGERVSEAVER